MKKLDTTAERTALWRALHLEIDHPPLIVKDLWALKLTRPAPGWQQRPDMKFTKPIRASIVGRARFVEDQVIKAHEGEQAINQYVILGAGLDSFALRYQPEKQTSLLQIYEIDQPGTLQWKAACIKEQIRDIPAHLHLIPMDFEAAMRSAEALKENQNRKEPNRDPGKKTAGLSTPRKAPKNWLESLTASTGTSGTGTDSPDTNGINNGPEASIHSHSLHFPLKPHLKHTIKQKTQDRSGAAHSSAHPEDQSSMAQQPLAFLPSRQQSAALPFDLQKPAIISCTGVTLYLSLTAIKDMLHLIANSFAANSLAIISFYEPAEALEGQDRKLLEISIAGAAASGTPMVSFFKESEVAALAAEAGLKQARIFNTQDLINLYFNARTDDLIPNKGELFLVAST